jgi:hypothetical protein
LGVDAPPQETIITAKTVNALNVPKIVFFIFLLIKFSVSVNIFSQN